MESKADVDKLALIFKDYGDNEIIVAKVSEGSLVEMSPKQVKECFEEGLKAGTAWAIECNQISCECEGG